MSGANLFRFALALVLGLFIVGPAGAQSSGKNPCINQFSECMAAEGSLSADGKFCKYPALPNGSSCQNGRGMCQEGRCQPCKGECAKILGAVLPTATPATIGTSGFHGLPTPGSTPNKSPAPTATAAVTASAPTATPAETATPEQTNTPTPADSPTPTEEPTDTSTKTPTRTPTPTATGCCCPRTGLCRGCGDDRSCGASQDGPTKCWWLQPCNLKCPTPTPTPVGVCCAADFCPLTRLQYCSSAENSSQCNSRQPCIWASGVTVCQEHIDMCPPTATPTRTPTRTPRAGPPSICVDRAGNTIHQQCVNQTCNTSILDCTTAGNLAACNSYNSRVRCPDGGLLCHWCP
jgi:hypothetical protein